ncbi:MAG: asparagine synthase (glutamine-hydrolyzing) [Acidobacteria bacterium]|nr:asparagine synthase (glutamine-hydrolyzing) [Acidobacteriota bacterium]
MCGITGFISNDRDAAEAPRAELLARMCESIVYRGPDEQGTIVRGRAALGMRRLSIIDIKSGQQPIFTPDGTLAIVYNGEVYNFKEVREELVKLGHTFKTDSDTEVVVHAYQQFGESCLEKLRGMFAFAIWDFRGESLFIARDRVGKKPLFYAVTAEGEFVFGSELKTLLVHGRVKREVDLAALDAYLSFGYVPEEFCILKDVKKLLPGHFLRFKHGQIEIKRYWDFDLSKVEANRSEEEWTSELRAKIAEAVKIRLISEVPLGAFLSGGVDSSTIVATMAKLSDQSVKTFSIGFREDSFDELKYARLAAREFKTDHHEFIVTPDLFDLIGEIVWHFDEPFADQSSLPTFMLSKMARDHVTVVLSGDGGDELFAGYERYVVDRNRDKFASVPAVFRNGVRRVSAALPHAARGKNFLHNVSLDSVDRYIDSISAFNGPRKALLYSGELRESLNGRTSAGDKVFQSYGNKSELPDAIARLLYLDSKTYLPGDILTKVDRMTMANSLEARVPLLDHELIEFVATMPSTLKMKGTETKYILKKAMEGIVPDEILYREKQGFGVPIGEWINDQLRERINDDLADSRTTGRGHFDGNYVNTLLKEHAAGRRDHANSLWMLWMLELWFRRYVDV